MTSHLLDSLVGFGYTKSEPPSSESEQHFKSLISEADPAPIHKFPAELLTDIFTFIVRGLKPYPYPRQATIHCLSQVCTFWRQIVHTTPRLWTFLDITGDRRKKFSDQYMAMVQTCLARSSPMPISICIKCSTPGTEAVLRSLFPSADRWQSLHIYDYSDVNAFSCLSDLSPGSLQTLEELCLKHSRRDLPTVKIFLSARRLRKVTLRVMHLSTFPMPWIQLTSLDLADNNPTSCLEILIQCTNIMEAKLSTVAWRSDIQITDLPITILPQLARLELLFDDEQQGISRDPTLFFQPLALPALSDLKLWFAGRCRWPGPIFTQFQLRSPNIERFEGINLPTSGDDLVLLLRHAPALKVLDLAGCSFDHNPFDALRPAEGDIDPLAPMLEELSLERINLTSDEGRMAWLEPMIRSRWWSDEELLAMAAPPRVAKWKNVYIFHYNYHFSEDFVRWMAVSKVQGLQITVPWL